MISRDPLYLGDASLGHYPIANSGVSEVALAVPKKLKGHTQGWYTVTRGRAIGIYLSW